MKVSVDKLRVFNIMLFLQSMVLLKEHLHLNYTMKQGCKLCTFYKIKRTGLPSNLFDLIPKSSHMYNTRSLEDVATLYSRTDIFKFSFFPSTISKWKKLDLKIRQSKTLLIFRNALIKVGRPIPKPIYNVHNHVSLKLLTMLRLGLSHLNQHKFNHNFQDCLNPLCSCSLEVNLFPISFCAVIITQTYVQPC